MPDYRFNPPPNWPTPPAGWSPPPGWQPDPAWGPLPYGWQLWVEDTNGATPIRPNIGARVAWISLILVLVLVGAASSGVSGAVIMAGLAGLVVGVIAVAKRSVRWLGISSRRAGVGVVSASVVALLIGTALAPATASTDAGTTSHDSPVSAPTQAPVTGTAAPTATAMPRPAGPERPGGVPTGAQAARVVEIVDGDTLVLTALAAGSVIASTEPVEARLLEIDAPEISEPYAAEASGLLASIAKVGSTVWVLRDQDPVDQYGRELLYLWAGDATFVNRELVVAGFATAAPYEPNDLYIDEMRSAELDAQNAERGVWTKPDPPVENTEPQPLVEVPDPPDEAAGSGCDPAYPSVCIPPAPPDLDCPDVAENNVVVRAPDPHGFDRDQDGIGCES